MYIPTSPHSIRHIQRGVRLATPWSEIAQKDLTEQSALLLTFRVVNMADPIASVAGRIVDSVLNKHLGIS